MLRARGEHEGSSLDGGRIRIPEEKEPALLHLSTLASVQPWSWKLSCSLGENGPDKSRKEHPVQTGVLACLPCPASGTISWGVRVEVKLGSHTHQLCWCCCPFLQLARLPYQKGVMKRESPPPPNIERSPEHPYILYIPTVALLQLKSAPIFCKKPNQKTPPKLFFYYTGEKTKRDFAWNNKSLLQDTIYVQWLTTGPPFLPKVCCALGLSFRQLAAQAQCKTWKGAPAHIPVPLLERGTAESEWEKAKPTSTLWLCVSGSGSGVELHVSWVWLSSAIFSCFIAR